MQTCHNFVNDQCTQEAGIQTVASSEKEEHHFTEEEALNHNFNFPLQTMQDVEKRWKQAEQNCKY